MNDNFFNKINNELYEQVESTLYGDNYSTYTQSENVKTSEEIIDDINEAIDKITINGIIEELKIIYYDVSEIVEKGQIIHLKETNLNPEYIVFNKKDYEENKELILSLNYLRPISNYYYFKEKIDKYDNTTKKDWSVI